MRQAAESRPETGSRPGVEALRAYIARRRGGNPDALDEWSAPDVLELTWMAGRRLCRGALLRARLGSSDGLIFCDRNVRIHHARHIHAGRDLDLEEGCFINGLSRRGVVFGDRCTVGRGAVIAPSGLLGGEPGEGLVMGDHSNLGAWAYVGCSGLITIGSNVLTGPRVSLLAEDHNAGSTDAPIKAQGVTRLPITIEDDVWLCAGATVVGGVTIGRGSIVAAGSVVTRDVQPFSVVAGVPAALMRSRLTNPI